MKRFGLYCGLLLIMISMFAVSCKTTGSSDWIMNPYDNTHKSGEYLMVVGIGNTKEEATNNAMQSLAQNFSVDIRSSTGSSSSGTVSVTNGQKNVYSSSSVSSVVTTVSNVKNLVGVETYNVAELDGKIFVRVGINIAKTEKILNARIASGYQTILNSISRAEKETGMKALSACAAIYEDAVEMDCYILQLEVLSGRTDYARLADKVVAIRNKYLTGKTISIKIQMPFSYSHATVKGLVESKLTEAGLSITNKKPTYTLDCIISTSSDSVSYSDKVNEIISVTLMLSTSGESNTLSDSKTIVSPNKMIAMQNAMEYIIATVPQLLSALLSV